MNRCCLAAVIGLFFGSALHSKEPLFAPAPSSPLAVGRGSGKLLLEDINGDRHVDLITQHLLGQQIGICFGDGKGRFTPAPQGPMKLEFQPGNISLADVNHDGVLDLGIASRGDEAEQVHVLLGDGKGAFAAAAGSPLAAGPTQKTYKPSLFFLDINEDGDLDIVTANGRRNSIETLFGDGRGSFIAGPVVRLEPGQDFCSFLPADVDGDRHLDLVCANSPTPDGDGNFLIRKGNGKGIFAEPDGQPVPLPSAPRIAAIADVNGDQRPDIVLTHAESKLTVLLSSERGGFEPAKSPPLQFDRPAFAVAVADVNQDQQADLVAATVANTAAPYESRIVVLLGNRGEFSPATGSPYPAGPGAYSLTLGDVNGDGKPDIAASSFEGDAVTLLLGQ